MSRWGARWGKRWGGAWGAATADDEILGSDRVIARKRKTDDDEILELVAMLIPFLDKLNSRGLK